MTKNDYRKAMSRRYIHGSQAPAYCEVFGQDESRNPYAMAFMFIVGVVIAIALVAL